MKAPFIPFIAGLTLAAGAQAATWDEQSDGDLSGSGLSPSTRVLDSGDNWIRGQFGNGDLDYLALTVLAGYQLDGIIIGVNTTTGLSRSFIGVQAGLVMTVPPTTGSAAGLLGWTHYTGADGVDLLPAMSIPVGGSTGFTPPLGSGAYTFWFNETQFASGLNYEFNFHVSAAPVPLPAGLPLLGSAVVALAGFARRRRGVSVPS